MGVLLGCLQLCTVRILQCMVGTWQLRHPPHLRTVGTWQSVQQEQSYRHHYRTMQGKVRQKGMPHTPPGWLLWVPVGMGWVLVMMERVGREQPVVMEGKTRCRCRCCCWGRGGSPSRGTSPPAGRSAPCAPPPPRRRS